MSKNNKIISLFSGAGGMDIGFNLAGFETAVAVEYDKSCCETLKKNEPKLNVIQGDISKISTSEILKIGKLKVTEPAGADEHWKTANTALSRVRDNFKKHSIDIPLVFIGAAIENSMSKEIFNQYSSGKIANCANLTMENQLINLCNWLVKL